MTFDALREQACEANLALVGHGLVLLTWGNASAFDPESGVMAIKPSGVPYADLTPREMVLVEVGSGRVLDGAGRPSSDTDTHRGLYAAFGGVRGVVHTHSTYATAWAQSGLDLPCLGTTHADDFRGPVPCTRPLSAAEIGAPEGYEHATGAAIVREFRERGLDPLGVPGVLVHGHAPFTWGESAGGAVHAAVVLERVAQLALLARLLAPNAPPLAGALLDRHHSRKHGPNASYGQPGSAPQSGGQDRKGKVP
ncbi:L-ribulose-5-phosphate 4-epimerase AraD [Deinococcus planocerae]|uniref:L-ribulose-5-phosphate 4-epimerase AraD n=1 Tax=Deinococcus planocerae TaxID=1737569 RepID=UPI000C7E93D2|nr:L-ribulose-5-phosphate 4-epimerase AraD [Deinococcus planocerae]